MRKEGGFVWEPGLEVSVPGQMARCHGEGVDEVVP